MPTENTTRNTIPGARARRAAKPDADIRAFLLWMRDHGFDGYHTSSDILEFYDWFCAEQGFQKMHPDMMRNLFGKLPGVVAERRRIASRQFDALRAYLERCSSSRGVPVRPELYRISSHEEMEQAAKVHARERARPPARRIAVDAMELSKAA